MLFFTMHVFVILCITCLLSIRECWKINRKLYDNAHLHRRNRNIIYNHYVIVMQSYCEMCFKPNTCIIMHSPDDICRVQKDGPGGKKHAAVPPVTSLQTLDGKIYYFDHGQMIEKGFFVSL